MGSSGDFLMRATRRACRSAVWLGFLAACVLLPATGATHCGEASAAPGAVSSATEGPALTLEAAPLTMVAGSRAVLTASLGIPGAQLQLSRRPASTDDDFTAVATLSTDAAGVATYAVCPRQSMSYRVEYAGDGAQWLPAAAEAVVAVAPHLSLSATARIYSDRSARLVVTVVPAHPGATVTLQSYTAGVWTDIRSLQLDSGSRARTAWRPADDGKYRLRAVMAEDADHVEGRSPTGVVVAVAPNPYRVPLTARRIIVVDLSEYRLRFYSRGRLLKSFPCVTGRPSLPTPLGHFRVYARGMWPGGPYGARILSYHSPCAIHGTNQPSLLRRFPRNFSHGCTRLLNAHVIWLYGHAPLGTPVWNVR